jgi:uncharacterized NAD(P)/FAD-binding protein YdhS
MSEADAGKRLRVGREKPPVAVIGGGFSGTMAAIQLARVMPPDQPILLCERGTAFAGGVAYSTALSCHLLNVRAANMSAFASEPTHFETWLAAQPFPEIHRTPAGAFASRAAYGSYLKAILSAALRSDERPGQLRLLPDSIIDCERVATGFNLTSASGRCYQAAALVLATGHVPPAPSEDPRLVNDPWAPNALSGLDDQLPVLVLGTGLTMVDVVLSLRQQGFQGPILALSRRGLVAAAHEPAAPWPLPAFTPSERHSVRLMLRRLRQEVALAAAQGIDWRGVIDSIRPITTEIWQGWSLVERGRFLRHARRWWDIHRHRMAPPNAAAIRQALADGSLQIIAARISRMRFDPDAVRIRYHPARGAAADIEVQRVIVATGLESAVRTTDRLMRQLITRGLARWDCHGFGIEVTDELQVIGGDGTPVPHLWALGPIVRGMFWECVAVPDIRRQAERFAAIAAASLEG